MSLVRLLSLAFACIFSCAAEWTPQQQQWSLAAAGILAEMNHSGYSTLRSADAKSQAQRRANLIVNWGIHSRADLLTMLRRLLRTEKPVDQIGWDLPRAIYMARWGVDAGFLNEKEAWDFIIPAAQRLQVTYFSWQQLGDAYLIGRADNYASSQSEVRQGESAYRTLLTSPSSPWRTLPWNLGLGSSNLVAPNADRTAQLWIQSHSSGLTCVRLWLPDQAPLGRNVEDRLLPAIEKMIGCSPRVTGNRNAGKDWVFDAECAQPSSKRETQVVTTIRLEGLAEFLRDTGITQVFSYVQHAPVGESSLRPQAADSWTFAGMQEHIDMRWLRKRQPVLTLTFGIPPSRTHLLLVAGAAWILFCLGGTAMVASIWGGRVSIEALRAAEIVRLLSWVGLVILAVSFRGLDVVTFWSGDEGLSGQLEAVIVLAPLGALVLGSVDLVLSWATAKVAAPDLTPGRILTVCLLRAVARMPMVAIISLLATRSTGWSFPLLFILMCLGLAFTYMAQGAADASLGRRRATTGELYDAVLASADRFGVALKRLYIEPNNAWVSLSPSAGKTGELVLPQRLVENLSRSDLDATIAHSLILLRNRSPHRLAVIGLVLLGFWTISAYVLQARVASPDMSLIALLLTASFCISVYHAASARMFAFAASEFAGTPGASDAFALGLLARLNMFGIQPTEKLLRRISKMSCVSYDRIMELARRARLPETGYPVPAG